MKIKRIEAGDKPEIIKLVKIIFEKFNFLPLNFVTSLIEYAETNRNDLKIIENDKIIGFHLLDEVKLKTGETFLEGFIMGIHPDFQRKGYGSALINFEKEFFKGKYDYISGSHDGRLENIEFWKRHREILKTSIKKGLSGDEFVSYETISYL